MILPKKRDPRFITIRRGGLLEDGTHHALAIWAAECAEHVLRFFDEYRPDDDRPRRAIALVRAWTRGEATMRECHNAAFASNAAGRDAPPAARLAALAAGQAVAVAHVAAHELGAAAYAIRAAREAAPPGQGDAAARAERAWQWERLTDEIRDLVLDDQKLRNALCWDVFVD
ncbi:putative immunity protein [Sorangium sp. So ce385]|uniref:putative immunity protein n=1 Tax=Sorangium sp. So ce385 TaxID=3133308 RepID=UPI003F5B89B7